MRRLSMVRKRGFFLWHLLVLIMFLSCAVPGIAAEPVKIVVGWQPYDTISYQVAIIQELKLWKKYMPEGVEIEFQPALQGAIISNNLLAGKQLQSWQRRSPNRQISGW